MLSSDKIDNHYNVDTNPPLSSSTPRSSLPTSQSQNNIVDDESGSIRQGEPIPTVNFKLVSRQVDGTNTSSHGPGALVWKDLTSNELFSKKRVVLFAVPGAFMAEPSLLNFIDEYINAYDQILQHGIDDVYCVSVNDAYVMREWGIQLGLTLSSNVFGFAKLKLLPDATGEFTRGMGMCCSPSQQAYIGQRSRRYVAVINDMEIEEIFVEDEESFKPNDQRVFGPIRLTSADALVKHLTAEMEVKRVFSPSLKSSSSPSFKVFKKNLSWNKKREVEKEKKREKPEKSNSRENLSPKPHAGLTLKDKGKSTKKDFRNLMSKQWSKPLLMESNHGRNDLVAHRRSLHGHMSVLSSVGEPELDGESVSLEPTGADAAGGGGRGNKDTYDSEPEAIQPAFAQVLHSAPVKRSSTAKRPSTFKAGDSGNSRRTSFNKEKITPGSAAPAPRKAKTSINIEIPSTVRRSSLDRLFASASSNANDTKSTIERVVSMEFPQWRFPNARNVIDTCINQRSARKAGASFSSGDWVEVLGPDMRWRLEMVTRVIKNTPEDWDWNDPDNDGEEPEWTYFYNAGQTRMLDADSIRSPEEGLKRIFGTRPWIWQQWALLKVEQGLRFQPGHGGDYMSVDICKLASEHWEQWMTNPKNHDFRNHFMDPRIGDIGRRELIHHVMMPFKLLDDLKEGSSEQSAWNFQDDPSISIFTYLGLLGSGFFIPCVICVIQLSIPVLLLIAVLENDTNSPWELGTPSIKRTSGSSNSHIMIFVIMVMYLIKVVPGTCVSFHNTLGFSDSVYSKLLSMRQDLWFRDEDSFWQKLGYKMEVSMNTAYVCLLYTLNIFILFNTDSAFEVLLNALAVEFVISLDEDLAQSDWWDPDKRWITAGAAEVVIRKSLRLSLLKNFSAFSKAFGVSEAALMNACDGDQKLFRNVKVALVDVVDPNYMTQDEEVYQQCIEAAKRMNNKAALQELEKPVVYFGFFDKLFSSLFRTRSRGMFEKFTAYRTWSRWDKVLYIAPLPDLDDLFTIDRRGRVTVREKFVTIVPTESEPFANFNPSEFATTPTQLFLQHVCDVMTFRFMIRGLQQSWTDQKYASFVFRIFDGFVEWLTYMTQILFPIITILAPVSAFRFWLAGQNQALVGSLNQEL